MRKEFKPGFVSLLQNEAFLNKVKETENSADQLNILGKEFPGQVEAIAYAVEYLRANLSDQKQLPPNDVAVIWNNIAEYADQNKRFTLRRFILFQFWQVAAVLILVLVSAVFVVHRLTRDTLVEMASIKTVVDDEAMIILSDGSKHKLNKKDSLIEYSANGGEVIVKGDKLEEKLENQNRSKVATINQIIVPYGRRHSITLSDGTRVQLNAGSRLVFPAEFSDKSREVYLKGEGYFEVFKNSQKPFIVKTDFIDIRVLGTVFNISAYEDEPVATAVLVEGKVVVSQKNKLFGTTEKNLSPGQGCFYSSETKTSEVRKVDLYEYVSWKDGLFLFKDMPLNNIITRLEKYYHRKILVAGGKLQNTIISGKLILSDDIDEVMQHLAKTLEARYEKDREGAYHITN